MKNTFTCVILFIIFALTIGCKKQVDKKELNLINKDKLSEIIVEQIDSADDTIITFCSGNKIYLIATKGFNERLLHIYDENGKIITESTNPDTIRSIVIEQAFDFTKMNKVQACESYRQFINTQVEMYYFAEGTWPENSLEDIKTNMNYFPDGIPTCPVDETAYVLEPSPYHRVSGHRKSSPTHVYAENAPIGPNSSIDYLTMISLKGRTIVDAISALNLPFLCDKNKVGGYRCFSFDVTQTHNFAFYIDDSGRITHIFEDFRELENFELIMWKFKNCYNVGKQILDGSNEISR